MYIRPPSKARRVWERRVAQLRRRDRALSDAVYQCMEDDHAKIVGLTYQQWCVQAIRNRRRLQKLDEARHRSRSRQ